MLDTGNGSDWTVALFGYVGAGDSSGSVMAHGPLAPSTLENGGGPAGRVMPPPGTWISTAVAVIPGAAETAGVSVSLQVGCVKVHNDGGTITSYE